MWKLSCGGEKKEQPTEQAKLYDSADCNSADTGESRLPKRLNTHLFIENLTISPIPNMLSGALAIQVPVNELLL